MTPDAMTRHDVRIDIAASIGRPGPLPLAATLFWPCGGVQDGAPLVFAVAGGGYARGYFDMRFPGHDGYSQAEHHAAHGIVMIGVNPIGVSDSFHPDIAAITLEQMADSYDAFCRAALLRIRNGTLVDGIAAWQPGPCCAIGQSMGGALTILAQGRHGTFDGIAALGYSAIHTKLPTRTDREDRHNRDTLAGVARGVPNAAVATFMMADYRHAFHWEDVPDDIVQADFGGGYPIRREFPPFGGTIPHCVVQLMAPGVVAPEAAIVAVPVFVGVGERDTCPDPHAEPAAYRGSRDVTLFIVPAMAHMHNFASSRERLWDRLRAWYVWCRL